LSFNSGTKLGLNKGVIESLTQTIHLFTAVCFSEMQHSLVALFGTVFIGKIKQKQAIAILSKM